MNKKLTPNINITQEITQDEEENFNLEFNLARTQKRRVNKATTLLCEYEDIFLSFQRGKGNTEQTVKYYEKCFRSIYRFLAYETSDIQTFNKMLDNNTNLVSIGRTFPLSFLELDNFEDKYKNYILDFLECSEQTMLNLFRGYRAIAYYAMEQGWIDKHTIHIKDIEPRIKNVYTQEEINRLLKRPNFENFIQYRNWVVVQYLLSTGNRISSVANLKVGDIDFDDSTINVNVQKNRQPIRITMVDELKNVLREYIYNYRCDEEGYPIENGYLFCNSFGKYCEPVSFGKSLGEYNKSRGVNKTSTHLWRHTFAKNWITSGGDILSLQKMLGHRSLKMVQRYSNLYSADLKPIAEAHAAINTVKRKTGRQKLQLRK